MNIRRQKGFSLVEVVITIVIIGIALIAAISGWGNIARHSGDVMWQTKVAYLGQAYLEDILSRRFDESSPLGGGLCTSCAVPSLVGGELQFPADPSPVNPSVDESRDEFDDVDDFDGLEEEAIQVFVDFVGEVKAYKGYMIEVQVSYEDSFLGSEYVKRVEVTVKPPANTGQSPVVFSALKGNY